ncbi:peptidase S8/S53 domain-containing protein [Blyttiomyces helicus]|uniref:Peptidase S8/S53 domain-containing protein n=1 Tax=Blyttiomyces helicus TaxID=388810 RepID=A0A4P9W8J6_9FUNG|nr:peptidase S8/S53 domain-containing protein [Blyttiomyces helicus]|eukprot:RKO88432.1 peptidase S8/S53 domain-containing protein [Blyttiomyces helicus]
MNIFFNLCEYSKLRSDLKGHIIKGYSANLPQNIVNSIKLDTSVEYVENDPMVSMISQQKNARWGLSRISKTRSSNDTTLYYHKNDGKDKGHGTHCSGIIAGKRFGACEKCNVIAVKVLNKDGSGILSSVIACVEWVVKHHRETNKTSVANMSLGRSFFRTLNRFVNSAVQVGIHFIPVLRSFCNF